MASVYDSVLIMRNHHTHIALGLSIAEVACCLSVTLSSHDVSTKMLMNTASKYEVVTESSCGESYFYFIKTAVRKMSGIMRAKMFPHRDSNPGLLGESQLS